MRDRIGALWWCLVWLMWLSCLLCRQQEHAGLNPTESMTRALISDDNIARQSALGTVQLGYVLPLLVIPSILSCQVPGIRRVEREPGIHEAHDEFRRKIFQGSNEETEIHLELTIQFCRFRSSLESLVKSSLGCLRFSSLRLGFLVSWNFRRFGYLESYYFDIFGFLRILDLWNFVFSVFKSLEV